jgi:hypothetical protein
MTMGIVIFAVLAVVGTVVLQGMGTATGCESSLYTFNTSAPYTTACYETTNASNTTSATLAGQNAIYLKTQLGSSSGGLASYAPALIAVGVGAIFISLLAGFMMQRRSA